MKNKKYSPLPREYFRLKTRIGVYIFTEKELKKALDRENKGVVGFVLEERDLFNH